MSHTISKPQTTIYYLALAEDGSYAGSGVVEAGSGDLASGAPGFETFTTQEALNARLLALNVAPTSYMVTPEMSVDDGRAMLRAQVNAIYAEKIEGPVRFKGLLFDGDAEAYKNLSTTLRGLDTMRRLDPAFNEKAVVTPWRSLNNTSIQMTAEDLDGLALAFATRLRDLKIHQWHLKDEIIAKSIEPRLLTVAVTKGWPEP